MKIKENVINVEMDVKCVLHGINVFNAMKESPCIKEDAYHHVQMDCIVIQKEVLGYVWSVVLDVNNVIMIPNVTSVRLALIYIKI